MDEFLVAELLTLAKRIQSDELPYIHDRWFTFDNEALEPSACRVAACLGGYASEHPPFQQLGMYPNILMGTRSTQPGNYKKYPLYGEPALGNKLVAMGAMQQFFGFSSTQVNYLFATKVEDVQRAEGTWQDPDARTGFEISDIIERLQRVIDGDIP